MKRLVLLLLFVSLWAGRAAAQSANPEPLFLHFETDRAELTAQAKTDLDGAVSRLGAAPEQFRVVVTGHTDSRGSLPYNLDLSQRRGRAVAEFLSAKGFMAGNIQLLAEGETRPVAQNASDAGMALNRRVEVRFERNQPDAAAWMERNSVPAAKLHFQAERGLQFESPRSGTKVDIPAGILVKKDGTPVAGEVDLQFREYRGVEDFLAAGIPMHYADERGAFFFNSGGMFEIRTFQKGEELDVAPGKSFSVRFAPTDQLSSPNLFLFNDATQRWDYVSSAAFAPESGTGGSRAAETAQPVVVTEADVIRDNTGKDLNVPSCDLPFFVFPTDADPADWLMQAVRTGAALAQGKDKMENWFRKYPNRGDAFFLASLERGNIELVGNLGSKFFPDDKTNTFKELVAFKDHYFESDSADVTKFSDFMNGPGAATATKVQQGATKYFKSLAISYEGNGKCVLTLNDGQTEAQVRARLRMSTELASRVNYNDADDVIALYNKLRDERQGAILNKIRNWRRFLELAPVFQTKEERCMSTLQWLDYFDKNGPAMRRRYEGLLAEGLGQDSAKAIAALEEYDKLRKGNSILRQFRYQQIAERTNTLAQTVSINKFGIYNCDQIFRLAKQPEMIMAAFQTPDGKPVQPMNFSILERDSRMFFSINANGTFYKLPGKRLDVVVGGTNGRVYHLAANDYAKLDFANRSDFTFTVNDVTGQVKSPKDWAMLLGI